MRRQQDNDIQKLAELYDQHAARLYRFLWAFLGDGDMAEDVLQEVFLELAKHPARLTRLRNPQSYVFQSARNKAIGFLRKKRHNLTREATSIGVIEVTQGNAAGQSEALSSALTRLPDAQREVITLKTYGELSFTEIGRQLGIPRDTAASRYRLGLEKLRSLLKADADEAK